MFPAMLTENKVNEIHRKMSGEGPEANDGALGVVRNWMHRVSSTSSAVPGTHCQQDFIITHLIEHLRHQTRHADSSILHEHEWFEHTSPEHIAHSEQDTGVMIIHLIVAAFLLISTDIVIVLQYSMT